MNLKKYEYYRTANGVLYNCDCLDIMPLLEPVDLVLTDPPYGIGDKMRGGTWGAAEKYEDFRKWDVAPKTQTLLKIITLCKNSIIWGGNYFNLTPSRCWLVWDKKNAVPTMADCELAWTNFNKPTKRMSLGVGVHNNGHPTEKPLALFMWCISHAGNPKSILDPYIGSGTTAIACERLDIKWIGIEISEKYCAIIKKRLIKETEQLKLF